MRDRLSWLYNPLPGSSIWGSSFQYELNIQAFHRVKFGSFPDSFVYKQYENLFNSNSLYVWWGYDVRSQNLISRSIWWRLLSFRVSPVSSDWLFVRYFCNGDLIAFLIYNSTAGEQIMSRTLVCTSIVMQRGRPFLAPLPSEEQLGLTSNFKMG